VGLELTSSTEYHTSMTQTATVKRPTVSWLTYTEKSVPGVGARGFATALVGVLKMELKVLFLE
jgi:hypothetical protein